MALLCFAGWQIVKAAQTPTEQLYKKLFLWASEYSAKPWSSPRVLPRRRPRHEQVGEQTFPALFQLPAAVRPEFRKVVIAKTGANTNGRVVTSHAIATDEKKHPADEQRQKCTARFASNENTATLGDEFQETPQGCRFKMVQEQIAQDHVDLALRFQQIEDIGRDDPCFPSKFFKASQTFRRRRGMAIDQINVQVRIATASARDSQKEGSIAAAQIDYADRGRYGKNF